MLPNQVMSKLFLFSSTPLISKNLVLKKKELDSHVVKELWSEMVTRPEWTVTAGNKNIMALNSSR